MPQAAAGDLLSSLSASQQAEIVKYVRFFQDKREQTLSAISGDFADTLEDRLQSMEPPYTLTDVRSALDHLEICVKDGVRQDLQRTVSMNVLLLKALLETAIGRGVELSIDTSSIENETLIAEAEKIRLEARNLAEPKPTFQKAVLRSLKDEHLDLVNQNTELADSNNTLRQRFNSMQQQLSMVLRTNNELKAQIDILRHGEEQAKREAHEAAASKDDAAVLRKTLTATRNDLARLQEEAEAKLNNSKQFQQLKKILNDKNARIADLRKRLQRYEPDTLAVDDDE